MIIIREIFTLDNLLHTVLGFALMGLFWLISGPGSFSDADWPRYALMAALVLYLRELGQVQARYHGNNFLRGWTLAGTDPDRAFHRHMEWIVPSIIINAGAYFMLR